MVFVDPTRDVLLNILKTQITPMVRAAIIEYALLVHFAPRPTIVDQPSTHLARLECMVDVVQAPFEVLHCQLGLLWLLRFITHLLLQVTVCAL